jgi:HlyD family secretion protein
MFGRARHPSQLAVCLLIGIGLLAGCAKAPPPRTKPEPKVAVITAAQGTVKPSTTLGGIIVPFQNVAIQSTLIEPVTSVLVSEGDHVSRGQVLARLDTTDLQANLRSALGTAASDHAKASQTFDQAGLTIAQNSNQTNSAQAGLRQAQATLAKDQLDLTRDRQLVANGYISQQAYDQQNTLVQNDVQAVRTQQVTLQNTQAQVVANGTTSSGLQGAQVAAARADEQTALGQADQIRAQIAKATIVSPVDAIVVNRNVNPGEYPGTRQLFTLQEVDNVYAVLNGSGTQVVGVQAGSRANITSSDNATLHTNGKIIGVLTPVNPGSTNFIVKVRIANGRGFWKPGMVVAGNVTMPPASGVRVPATAFLDDTHSSVQVIRGGKVATIPVVMRAADSKNAIVTGLPIGATVISNGQLGLTDDQAVSAQQVAAR